jgi:hypothetical protein
MTVSRFLFGRPTHPSFGSSLLSKSKLVGLMGTALIFMASINLYLFTLFTVPYPGSMNAIGHGLLQSLTPLHGGIDAEQTCIADYRTNNLSPAGRNFIGFDDIPNHDEEECINDVNPDLFVHWRRNNETICSHADMLLQKYTNRQWEGGEGHPTIHLYKNVWLRSFYSPIQNLAPETFTCQYLNETRGELKAVARNTSCMNQPAIRVASFDPWNPYERFHAHLNVGMVITMFNITNPQIFYIVKDEEVPDSEIEIWESFGTTKPIILSKPDISNTSGLIFVPYMIDMGFSGGSMLVAHGGAMYGRGRDHHCKSKIFQGVLSWMKTNMLGSRDFREEDSSTGDTSYKPIKAVWSSRGPYCCRPIGEIYTPTRPFVEEKELVHNIGLKLGNNYKIEIVNFGNISPRESIRIASQSQIFVGVHGAGLVWSGFMSPHSGLLELFGGDRGSDNRHYHNIASLADIHYQSIHVEGSAMGLTWNTDTVDEIVKTIQNFNLDKEPH